MATFARMLSRAFTSIPASNEVDILKQVALFAGAGLLVSLLFLTYGLDLSPGFF